jgi:hypothetical protein
MIRIPANIEAFSAQTDSAKLFQRFADLIAHYNKKGDYDTSISFSEKDAKVNQLLQEEIAKLAKVDNFSAIPPEMWVTNPMYKWATFAVLGSLIDMIIPDTIIDSIGMYTEVRTGGFGDNFSFDIEPNDLFYVTKAGRGKRHAEGQKSFNGQVVVTPVEHDIAAQVNLYRVLSGKESLAAFAMKCVRSMETEMAYDAYSAFNTAMGAVPSTSGKELTYTGFTKENFIELTDKVAAYNNGAKPVVSGTRAAVSAILPDDTNYRIQIDSDYVKIGYVPNFFGVDVIVMPQKANWKDKYQTVLDDTKLYVMSPTAGKPIKLCIEGSTLTVADDVYANANLTQQVTMKKMWATGVASAATYGELNLS